MGQMHNLQMMLPQLPRVAKLSDAQTNIQPNGSQIINVINQDKQARKPGRVFELTELSPSHPIDPKRDRLKKLAKRQLDLMG